MPGRFCRHPIAKGGDTRQHVLIQCLNENIRRQRAEKNPEKLKTKGVILCVPIFQPKIIGTCGGFILTAGLVLLALGLVLPAAAQAKTVTADVVILDHVLVFNRLGAQNLNGMIYALKRDVVDADNVPSTVGGAIPASKLRPDKRPRAPGLAGQRRRHPGGQLQQPADSGGQPGPADALGGQPGLGP